MVTGEQRWTSREKVWSCVLFCSRFVRVVNFDSVPRVLKLIRFIVMFWSLIKNQFFISTAVTRFVALSIPDVSETKRFAWEWTVVLSTSLNRSGSALNKDKFTPLKWLFFYIVWISWADLGSLRSVLVHLLCPYIYSPRKRLRVTSYLLNEEAAPTLPLPTGGYSLFVTCFFLLPLNVN